MKKPEPMSDFFRDRLEGYDAHMLEEVEGCRTVYERLPALLPEGLTHLLDLGCGTGLELEGILARFPELNVSGIDLSGPMLARLREKFPDRELCLVAGDYRRMKLGIPFFGAAVAVETLHHLTREEKAELLPRIREALLPGGIFINADYMLRDREEADRLLAEAEATRREHGIAPDAPVHLDIPLTVSEEIALLREAGFSEVTEILSEGNTVLLLAKKP